MKAYEHLVKYALNKGYVISVWDGEEWQVKRSAECSEIISAIESVEEAELKVYNDLKKPTWVWVSAYGLEDEETLIDYNDNQFMKDVEEDYENLQNLQNL